MLRDSRHTLFAPRSTLPLTLRFIQRSFYTRSTVSNQRDTPFYSEKCTKPTDIGMFDGRQQHKLSIRSLRRHCHDERLLHLLDRYALAGYRIRCGSVRGYGIAR